MRELVLHVHKRQVVAVVMEWNFVVQVETARNINPVPIDCSQRTLQGGNKVYYGIILALKSAAALCFLPIASRPGIKSVLLPETCECGVVMI